MLPVSNFASPPRPQALKANHHREGASFTREASDLITRIRKEEVSKVIEEGERLFPEETVDAYSSKNQLLAGLQARLQIVNDTIDQILIHPTSPNTDIHLKETKDGQYHLSVLPNGDQVQAIDSFHLKGLSDTPENEKDRLLVLSGYLGTVLDHLG